MRCYGWRDINFCGRDDYWEYDPIKKRQRIVGKKFTRRMRKIARREAKMRIQEEQNASQGDG